MTRRLEFSQPVVDRVQRLSDRDRQVVGDNIAAVLADPQHAGHPCGLSGVRALALQHVCPHSWVVVYRWQGHDPTHPYGVVTVEGLVDRY
jgi:hypothetical protein